MKHVIVLFSLVACFICIGMAIVSKNEHEKTRYLIVAAWNGVNAVIFAL